MAGQADSLKSIFFALGANFAIFVAKLAAALYTGSGAMLAEVIHSLADSGNQLLLIVGLRGAKRPPSDIIALMIGLQVKRLLIGHGVDTATQQAISTFLSDQREIKQIFNLITLQLGNDVMVAVKAEMEDFPNQRAMIEAVNR